MKIKTDKQSKRDVRNEKIRADFEMLYKIHGNSAWGVASNLARKYKVSVHTILRCVKGLYSA